MLGKRENGRAMGEEGGRNRSVDCGEVEGMGRIGKDWGGLGR